MNRSKWKKWSDAALLVALGACGCILLHNLEVSAREAREEARAAYDDKVRRCGGKVALDIADNQVIVQWRNPECNSRHVIVTD